MNVREAGMDGREEATSDRDPRLQETGKGKREKTVDQTSAPLPLELPAWMMVDWSISAEESTVKHNRAGALHLVAKAPRCIYFARYLCQLELQMLRIKIQAPEIQLLKKALVDRAQNHTI